MLHKAGVAFNGVLPKFKNRSKILTRTDIKSETPGDEGSLIPM